MDKLNLDDFKKWMSSQKNNIEKPRIGLVGLQVESKLKNQKRLIKNIESYDGDIEEVTADFLEYGGIILEVNDRSFLIEVNSGIFNIHRCFVKKQD
jgi:hypothetical protein